MSCEDTGQASAQDAGFRAGIEQILAVVALVPASVPLLFASLLTWALIGRPLLFRQERAGLHGAPFMILKFRTMTNAIDPTGKLLPDAQRTTFITRFLRRIRIDELPQLFSIARGDMAIVGPRPLLPATVRDMGRWGRIRCGVRPGLTGWAQVNGNTLLNDGQKLAFDIWYVYHRSLRLDLLIIWKTLLTLLSGERINTRHLAAVEAFFAALAQQRKGDT